VRLAASPPAASKAKTTLRIVTSLASRSRIARFLSCNQVSRLGFPSTHVRAFWTGEGSAADHFNCLLSFQIRRWFLMLTLRTKKEQCSSYVLDQGEPNMLKTFVEEAAALASIVLFVGMIAVWAQVIPQL
jgi:hypothetical protein